MLNAETARGQVLFLAEDFEEEAASGAREIPPCAEEAEVDRNISDGVAEDTNDIANLTAVRFRCRLYCRSGP